ncbi:MAG: hypothetical protein IT426_09930 [Pirellulales bacterium]|nr:hypothetical protein [Pirellulales bacterium]
MSRTGTKNRKAVSSSGEFSVLQETRIDPAHHPGGDDGNILEVSSPDAGCESALVAPGEPAVESLPPDLAGEQLRRQAEQLAEYLRARQRELDHRESQLNAQAAQLESDARTARIWLGEREAELQDREREQNALESLCRRRLERLAAAEAAMERRAAEGHSFEESKQAGNPIQEQEMRRALREISATWGEQSEELAAQSAGQANPSDSVSARESVKLCADYSARKQRIEERDAELKRKLGEVQEAERQTAAAQAEILRIRAQLLEEREAHREEMRSQRRRMDAERRRTMAELEKKREALERRAESAERCRTALEQLRAELQRLHRETLEIRLATEELWAQLSGTAPPAALTRSLGRIRAQLADRDRAADAELRERKKELESIRGQLAAQYEKLAERKGQFERWAAGREREAEQQAARLIARERILKDAESRFAERTRQGELERVEFEQEIRRLRLQLISREGSARVA